MPDKKIDKSLRKTHISTYVGGQHAYTTSGDYALCKYPRTIRELCSTQWWPWHVLMLGILHEVFTGDFIIKLKILTTVCEILKLLSNIEYYYANRIQTDTYPFLFCTFITDIDICMYD